MYIIYIYNIYVYNIYIYNIYVYNIYILYIIFIYNIHIYIGEKYWCVCALMRVCRLYIISIFILVNEKL